MNYTIDKTHIDQLTSEQKQKLRDLWTPEKGQKVMLERGRVYTIKAVTTKKIKVGSFEVVKDKVLPLLAESDLIHGLSLCCMTLDKIIGDEHKVTWRISVHDAYGGDFIEKEVLIDALWEVYKSMELS